MRAAAYDALGAIRREFASLVARWTEEHEYLPYLLERLRAELGYDDYRIETPIVFNRALSDIQASDRIRVVLVADNPGKNEQLAANNRYLVGQSGKLAEGWFARELGIDFRKEVLILNKTPVHTPKTAELRKLLALAGRERGRLHDLLVESQVAMARLAVRSHEVLSGEAILWISGCGELKKGGIFEAYRDELAGLLASMPERRRRSVRAFNHFSMNQFAIELKRKSDPACGLEENLARIGAENRERVFGA